MSNRASNEGFRMLDDFVCEAIQVPGALNSEGMGRGRNEGAKLVEEVVLEPGSPQMPRSTNNDLPGGTQNAVYLDDSIQSFIYQLAIYISRQDDPGEASTQVLERLNAELSSIRRVEKRQEQ